MKNFPLLLCAYRKYLKIRLNRNKQFAWKSQNSFHVHKNQFVRWKTGIHWFKKNARYVLATNTKYLIVDGHSNKEYQASKRINGSLIYYRSLQVVWPCCQANNYKRTFKTISFKSQQKFRFVTKHCKGILENVLIEKPTVSLKENIFG